MCALGSWCCLRWTPKTFLGVMNRGSPWLSLKELARELFGFRLDHRIILMVEWVPREEKSLADELSKLIIPDDWMLRRELF